MKILYINDFAPTFPGSFFVSLYYLSKKLHKEGHDLFYIFPIQREYIHTLNELGKVYYLPTFMGKKFDFGLIRLVYSICKENKIDIVHTNFGFAAPFTASLLSKIIGFKHIAHERSLSSYYGIQNIIHIKKYLSKFFFKLLMLFSNTKYIAISAEVKENLVLYNGIKSHNILVIPNAVLPYRFNNYFDKEKLDNLKKIKKNYNIIGMVAHLGPQKDHETFIDAAELIISKLPNSVFVLIGGNLVNDQINFKSLLENKIKKKNLDGKFMFLGEIKNPFPFIELFDIGCLISNREGFGNALVEYMLKKKPVIGTAVGGIKDIIDDGINGFLIPPKRADILAEKIVYLLENPDLAQKMGEKGYEKAITNYDMETWVRSIIKLYRAIL